VIPRALPGAAMAAVMVAAPAVPGSPGGFDFRSVVRGPSWIDEAFADSDDRLVQWRKGHIQALHQDAQRAARELKRERVGLEDLSTDITNTARLQADAAKLRIEGARLGEAVLEAVSSAAKRSEAASQARDSFLRVEQVHLTELHEEERALGEQDAAVASRLAEVECFLGLYQERLGLRLSRAAPQMVRLAFTLIDERRPEREFSFTLGLHGGVDAGVGYHIAACDPPLPQRRAAPLLRRLNDSHPSEATALPAFICGMRRVFLEEFCDGR